jgi:hypothetical protein
MSGCAHIATETSKGSVPVIVGTPVVGTPAAYDVPTIVYDGLHVLAINICQLHLFKRYDFVSMFAFRLAYYAVWHVVWGHVRLGVLF